MTNKEYIYALTYGDDVFYIGRTNNLERRMKEHRYSSKNGHEDKYCHIRINGDKWSYLVLDECERIDDECFEQFWMLQFLKEGYTLTNMKMGDSEHVDYTKADLSSIAALRAWKLREKRRTLSDLKRFSSIAALRALKLREKRRTLSDPMRFSSAAANTTVFCDDLKDLLNGNARRK
jgi:hypothetical protein